MKITWIGGVLGFGTLLLILLECCKPGNEAIPAENTYTGSASCQSCHSAEHADWLGSHHYLAMLPANDSTVSGDFDNAVLSADGVTSKFFKKGDKFYINTEDETGTYRDMEVLFTFGYEPLQQYLVAFPGGKMQATRMSWDTKAGKWFHQYAGEKMPPGDWLHWTGNGQNWNTMCASCHSTNVKKGYEFTTDTYQTTYNEINVSCESCHGPGKNHIDYINGKDYKKGKKVEGSFLFLYTGANRMNEINTCGYCHARRADITENVHPGAEVLDDYIPELPTTPFFHVDGQMNDEDYNYTSFLQSKMFQRGVQCTNCHNPHSGKLKMEGPTVCGQCHATTHYESEAHTLHKVGTVGVNCISCHMPSKYYMGNDLRHDHTFRVPRPDMTVAYGVPNTCNACHSDKSAQWAADAIEKGYGKKPGYHWSEDLAAGSRLQAGGANHLVKLVADSSVPNMARAAAIRYLGQLQEGNPATPILKYLQDSSALVRHSALQALRSFPPQFWANHAVALFSDKVRAVRIAAANLYLDYPQNQIPAQYFQSFTNAKNELYRYTLFQTDFAQGNLQAGDYYRRINDLNNAEFFYKRAVAKDSQLVNARVNLASTLNALGRNEEALNELDLSAKIEPRSDHIFFTKGLLYAEMGNFAKAEEALQKASLLNPNNVRALYNHGLLLAQQGKQEAAENRYKQALKVDPYNGSVLNALTILYLQQNKIDKAIETGRLLRQFHGGNPEYAELLERLRI
jgi:predicted CXXCH cytochrome family protein